MKPQLLIVIFLSSLSSLVYGQVDQRYPYRIPDWLWKDQIRSASIDEVTKKKVDSLIVIMENYYNSNKGSEGDSIELIINQMLNSHFTLLNLSTGAFVVHSKNNKTHIALQLDPFFKEESKSILKAALQIFSEIALDEDVIKEALSNSIDFPTPFPEMYKDSNLTESGLKIYDKEYAFMLRSRVKPASLEQFKKQMENALSTFSGDPALILISAYQGNGWWGRAHSHYYYSTSQHLSKFSPTQGYFYINLNKDSLEGNKSPEFWASKIAHEMLHNLGYYHPIYNDVKEKDLNNQGKRKAFIVAYEFAVLSKALLLKKKN